MTTAENTERNRVRAMLRQLRVGTRVHATFRAGPSSTGPGTVVALDPFYGDGVKRIQVRWDYGAVVSVLPASIDLL